MENTESEQSVPDCCYKRFDWSHTGEDRAENRVAQTAVLRIGVIEYLQCSFIESETGFESERIAIGGSLAPTIDRIAYSVDITGVCETVDRFIAAFLFLRSS